MSRIVLILIALGFGGLLLWLFFTGTSPAEVPEPDPTFPPATFDALGGSERPTDAPPEAISSETVRSVYAQVAPTSPVGQSGNLTTYGTWQNFTSYPDAYPAIPAQDFLAAFAVDAPSLINQSLSTDGWSVYRCEGGGRVFNGFLGAYTQATYPGNIYDGFARAMREWEPRIVADMAPIIFPEAPADRIVGTFDFIDTDAIDIRRHTTALVDGERREFGYYLIADEFLVGTDLQCIEDVRALMFDLDA